MTVPTWTAGGTVASTLGVPHGVGSEGSPGFQVSATKPVPTSSGVRRAAPACSSIEASDVEVAAAVVVGAAVGAAALVVVTESSEPLLQPAARSTAAMVPSRRG